MEHETEHNFNSEFFKDLHTLLRKNSVPSNQVVAIFRSVLVAFGFEVLDVSLANGRYAKFSVSLELRQGFRVVPGTQESCASHPKPVPGCECNRCVNMLAHKVQAADKTPKTVEEPDDSLGSSPTQVIEREVSKEQKESHSRRLARALEL